MYLVFDLKKKKYLHISEMEKQLVNTNRNTEKYRYTIL